MAKHYVKSKNEIRRKHVVHVYTVLGVGNYVHELDSWHLLVQVQLHTIALENNLVLPYDAQISNAISIKIS